MPCGYAIYLWTRPGKIARRVQRTRHKWLQGWDVDATVFRPVQASSQYNPGEQGLYQVAHISMVPGICAVLEDESNLYKLKLDDKVIYDARSVASLSRRIAEGRYISQDESAWRPKSDHFSAWLGVDETYRMKVDKQIQRIVVPRSATNLTLKKVKGHRQGHDMVPPERSCHKEHTCQVSKLYL